MKNGPYLLWLVNATLWLVNAILWAPHHKAGALLPLAVCGFCCWMAWRERHAWRWLP